MPGPERVYAIKAGKLVDPEKGTTETNQIILVRGKKIEAVGPNLQIPADAKIIDLSKSTVLPGLFDAHTHLCMTLKKDRDGNNYYFTTIMDPTPYRAIVGVANMRETCWLRASPACATLATPAIMWTSALYAKPSSEALYPARQCSTRDASLRPMAGNFICSPKSATLPRRNMLSPIRMTK